MHYPNVHKLATTSAASIYCNIDIAILLLLLLLLLLMQRCIRKTFAQAGQDPWAADTTAFKQHLDSLCSNPAYGILTPKQVRHNIADQLLANQMAQLQL